MLKARENSGNDLRKSLGPMQFLTIGLGAIMGVAWAIVLGNWLSAAAPAGVVAGFVIGGAIMLLVAACYAELATTFPRAGGDVIYALELFGPGAAFCVGWFLVLMAISITSFEAISIAWFVDTVFAGFQGGVAYRVFGHDVYWNALLLGLVLISAITFVNYHGARSASRLQDIFTALKALAAIAFIGAAWSHGQAENLLPLGTPVLSQPAWVGALWIAATAPVWYGGFQVVPQAIEERGPHTSLRTVAHMTVLTVAIGIAFYCAVVLASAYILPWRSLVAEPLPAVSAIRSAFLGGLGGSLVLAAIALGILATWNACFLWATRLLYAMGKLGLAPASLARTNAYGAPGTASLFVGCVGLAGVLLGRGGLVPIINMATISLALSYAMCCGAALRLRQNDPAGIRPYRVIGGVLTLRFAVLLSGVMALFAFIEPLTRSDGWPLEWTLMLAWAGAGVVAWRVSRKSGSASGSHGPKS